MVMKKLITYLLWTLKVIIFISLVFTFILIQLQPSYSQPSGSVYWSDSFFGTIQRANLEGGLGADFIENLVIELEDPRRVALDLVNHKIYWTEGEVQKIQRSDLDGSDVEDIVVNIPETPQVILIS
jgi:hypothetical protein